MSVRYRFFIILCVVTINYVRGAASSVCPESKKQYPGDCRLFYKCVLLSESAQAYVWIPSRCTAGLVYHPKLQNCVFPTESWECNHSTGDLNENLFYSTKNNKTKDIIKEMTNYSTISTVQNDKNFMSRFNGYDKLKNINPIFTRDQNKDIKLVYNGMEANTVPLSAVNNPSVDPIGTQMHRLTQLINSLKATSTSYNTPLPITSSPQSIFSIGYSIPYKQTLSLNFPPYKEILDFHDTNLLPAQINKITAQLITPITPQPEFIIKQNGIKNFITSTTKTTTATHKIPNEQLVSQLYNKYLSQNSFLKAGEFIIKKNMSTTPPNNKKKINRYSNKNSCKIGHRLPDPNNCSKYFICKNTNRNSMLSFTCPPNTAFNKYKKVCDIKEYTKCNQNINYYQNDDINIEINNGKCEENGSRIMDPTSRNHFILCLITKDGGWISRRVKCPKNLQYCAKKKICLSKSYCH